MKTIFVGPQGIRAPYRTLAERVLPRARVAHRRPAWNGGEGTGVAYPRSYVSRFCAGLCDDRSPARGIRSGVVPLSINLTRLPVEVTSFAAD